jgi:DNA-binding XRE family transcriptional regulator
MTADELRAHRAALGLSQIKLGTMLGVSESTMIRWEMDRYPIPSSIALALAHIRHLAKDAARKRLARQLESERRKREQERAAIYRVEPPGDKFW